MLFAVASSSGRARRHGADQENVAVAPSADAFDTSWIDSCLWGICEGSFLEMHRFPKIHPIPRRIPSKKLTVLTIFYLSL
jgi:hypothetical protein